MSVLSNTKIIKPTVQIMGPFIVLSVQAPGTAFAVMLSAQDADTLAAQLWDAVGMQVGSIPEMTMQ